MRTEHARLVELVSQTQRDESTGWTKRGGKRLVLPGVIFIPSLYERHRDETRPTFASRGAMFMFSTGLSTLFGACSTWDMNDKRVPFGLVAGSAAALALGVVFARKVSRADRAREAPSPHVSG